MGLPKIKTRDGYINERRWLFIDQGSILIYYMDLPYGSLPINDVQWMLILQINVLMDDSGYPKKKDRMLN